MPYTLYLDEHWDITLDGAGRPRASDIVPFKRRKEGKGATRRPAATRAEKRPVARGVNIHAEDTSGGRKKPEA